MSSPATAPPAAATTRVLIRIDPKTHTILAVHIDHRADVYRPSDYDGLMERFVG